MKKKIIIAAIAVILLAGLAAGFKLLVKVGNPKYFYNYMHDTAGSLEVEHDMQAVAGADAVEAEAVADTRPESYGIVQSLEENGEKTGSYSRQERISMNTTGLSEDETFNESLLTFRGNFTRTKSAIGNVAMSEEKFDRNYWTYSTGKVLKSNGVDYWSGNGWTGQPLLAKWNDEMKSLMNMYDSAKAKKNLTEVIYTGMDGWIHFLDMETGEETRPGINVGMTFKGTASIYSIDVPLLFCGSGDAQTGPFGENISPRCYIYSLIDGKLLYEYGYNDAFAPRIWHAYDSSPVIDTVTDTLIQPGENGIIYTMKLNTVFDKTTGALSIAPDNIVKFSFTIPERYKEGGRLWGSECSAAVWDGYMFIGDNSGMVYCLNLNTMSMVWAQDTGEDINSTPVLEIDKNGNKYLYVATTLKYGYNEHNMGEAAIYKLNAMNGKIIWKKPYEVHTVKGLAGGVLSTGVPGEGVIEDYIIYSVSKTPELEGGYLVALDKETGSEVWRLDLDMYSWSSTLLTYTETGKPYIIQGCQNGDLILVNAENGELLDRLNFGSGIEATPVISGNRIVLGTRSEKIIGVLLR